MQEHKPTQAAFFKLANRSLLFFLVTGTLVRLYYGIKTGVWNKAHDQIAWEIPLHEIYQTGKISFKQLMNYPHEGGTFFLSLISLIYLPFVKSFPVLTLTACLTDLFSRWIQIIVVKKIFGERTAWFFGLWTVLSVPLMLPWGMAFFGLHNSSVWLFLFIYLVCSKPLENNRGFLIGLFSGFAIAFTYHNIILVPAFLAWLFLNKSPRVKQGLLFLTGTLVMLVPHILMRLFVDLGFPLEANTILSAGRPVAGDLNLYTDVLNFFRTLLIHLPDSINLPTAELFRPRWFQLFFSLTLAACFILFLVPSVARKKERGLLVVLTLLFVLVFSLSSMYTNHFHDGFFYSYRHFTFILPVVFLFIIDSVIQWRKPGTAAVILLLAGCSMLTINFIRCDVISSRSDYKVAGWIITRKYANDVPKLISLQKTVNPEKQRELTYGFGWGLAVHNLYQKNPDTLIASRLNHIYRQFPDSCAATLYQGMNFAFKAGVTPTLNPEFRTFILEDRAESSENHP